MNQKYVNVWNNSYRTPTEHWQKTSDFPKCKKLPTYLGRAKEKRKNRDKRTGSGPAPLGGSCEGGSFHTLGSPFTGRDRGVAGGKLWSHRGEPSNRGAEGKAERFLHRGSVPTALTSLRGLSAHPPGRVGAGS